MRWDCSNKCDECKALREQYNDNNRRCRKCLFKLYG